MNKHIVFVYGTLKKGFPNNRLLNKSKLLTEACYPGNMYDIVYFPGVKFYDSEKNLGDIHGELWEVDDDTLVRLDELEGVPHLYTRIVIDSLDDLNSQPIYSYQINNVEGRDIIPTGIWK